KLLSRRLSMEIVAIVTLAVTVIAVLIAFLQLTRTPKLPKDTKESKKLPATTVGIEHKDSSPKIKESSLDMKSLVAELLPYNVEQFDYGEFTAWTEDDTAGLSLISEMIGKKAEREIHVIGRGTQLEEAKTKPYISAVANAIIRRVIYQRILIIDPALPQNALLWLLLIERFLRSPEWRDLVRLYVIKMNSTNMAAQFQIVDGKFLHRVVRYYSETDFGASKQSQSFFALLPNEEVIQHSNMYQTHLINAGNRYKHHDVADLLTRMLHDLDTKK